MSRPGPIGESVLRARKSLALHLAISEALCAAFLEESDDALPRTVVAALSRISDELSASSKPQELGSDHWVAVRLFMDPVILSAATARAARVIEGASGLGASVGMPRRANDFPDVTPFGLGLFYEASFHHSKKGGPSFNDLDRLFSLQCVEAAMRERATSATLTDALLLSLVPFAKSHLTIAAQKGQGSLPDETSEVAQMSEVLAGLRQGKLPDTLPRTRIVDDLLGCESFHGLLQAAIRLGAVAKDKADQWPSLITAYLPGGSARQAGQEVADVPLIICALASTWLKASWRLLPPGRKEAFLADFSSLVAGCAHEQAATLPSALNRTVA
jgi:hypothetical protein